MNSGKAHSRVRFGPYELDRDAHVLRKNRIAIRLQEQPWQVLCALLEKPGEVVTREELQKRLWPEGTFVDFEQSLNKAVNKLREALSDSADKPRYVETLPRHGYRFVAPVEEDRPGVQAPEKTVAPNTGLRAWLAGAAGVLSVVLVTGLWPVSQPRATVRQLTSDGFWKSDVLVVKSGKVLYVAAPGRPPDSSPGGFWSVPTGGGMAQLQQSPCPTQRPFIYGTSDQHRQMLVGCRNGALLDLWSVGFDGDNVRSIGSIPLGSYELAMSPDLKTLLFSRPEGLFVKALDGGEEKLLARVQVPMPVVAASSPSHTFWHPSGERIGFTQLDGNVMKLREVRSDGTGVRPLVAGFAAEQTAGQWSPDGTRLYFVSQNEIYVQGSRRWLGWMRKPAPVRLTVGSIRFSLPFEDPADPLTVYSRGEIVAGELMKLNRRINVFEPYLGGLPADCLDYSPDGQWIAYASFPRGALWKCKRDGSGKVLLDDSLFIHMPRWSPDGSRIAFSARGSGPTWRIYTISATGGKSKLVPGITGSAFDPTWSPDGKRIVFAPFNWEEERIQERHVSIVSLEAGEIRAVPGSDELWSVRWSPDGNWLVAFSPTMEPFLYSFKANTWEKLRVPSFGFPHWSKDSRYLYGLAETGLIRVEIATQRMEQIRTITEFNTVGLISPGACWTPDDEAVVLKDNSTCQIYRIDRDR